MKTKCEYSGTLFIISRKYFSVFRGPHLPLDTPFWTRCFPLVMQSRKAGFPFAARARKREPCLQRYVSRMTRTENFLSQFFSKFFWKPLFSTFYGTLFIISRKYFSVFRSPHLPLDTLIKKSSYSWTNQKVQLDFLLLIKKSSYSWTNQKVQL